MKKKQTILSQDFPKKIRQLRLNQGWSQGELAKKIDADPNRISKYERGVMWPTMELVVRMANVYQVSVDYLIRDEQPRGRDKIKNRELLSRLEKIDMLSDKDQEALIIVIDAFIKKHRFEKVAND